MWKVGLKCRYEDKENIPGNTNIEYFENKSSVLPVRTHPSADAVTNQALLARDRRYFLRSGAVAFSLGAFLIPITCSAEPKMPQNSLVLINDPQTYPALSYAPQSSEKKQLPLIVFLHGAGMNEQDAWNLADPNGEHAGLIPSLIASGKAPKELTDNFVVVAPYSQGKSSFYEEPRRKLLQFIDWYCSNAGQQQSGRPEIDPSRIFLFGFSDGATVGVELLTTQRFRGAIIAAYGFTGKLPDLALRRLAGLPIWVFHSEDDVIFSVKNSDRLVQMLKEASSIAKDDEGSSAIIRYTRFSEDQEGFSGRVRGHSTGITASRTPGVYRWLLTI